MEYWNNASTGFLQRLKGMSNPLSLTGLPGDADHAEV